MKIHNGNPASLWVMFKLCFFKHKCYNVILLESEILDSDDKVSVEPPFKYLLLEKEPRVDTMNYLYT